MTATGTTRLTLRSLDLAHTSDRYLDGAWWPTSYDLESQIVELLADVAAAGFVARRVNYDLTVWTEAPRKISVDGRRISLGGFRVHGQGMITLIDDSGSGRLELLVVPPDTDPDVAARAMKAAGTDGGQESGADILTAARGSSDG